METGIIVLSILLFIAGVTALCLYFYSKDLKERLEASIENNKLLMDNYTKSQDERFALKRENAELNAKLLDMTAIVTKNEEAVQPTPIIKYMDRNIINLEISHYVDLCQLDRIVTEDEIEAHIKNELANKAKDFVSTRKGVDLEKGCMLYKAYLSVARRD